MAQLLQDSALSKFLGKHMRRAIETTYNPYCTSTHQLPSLPTYSRFLSALPNTVSDPGGLPGKVTHTFIPDR